MKKFKRSETFKGLFWPKYYKDIKRLISECKIISESIKTANFEDIVDLKFDFKRGDKVTAEQSNLADGDTLDRRINAIRQGFKRYKNHYS